MTTEVGQQQQQQKQEDSSLSRISSICKEEYHVYLAATSVSTEDTDSQTTLSDRSNNSMQMTIGGFNNSWASSCAEKSNAAKIVNRFSSKTSSNSFKIAEDDECNSVDFCHEQGHRPSSVSDAIRVFDSSSNEYKSKVYNEYGDGIRCRNSIFDVALHKEMSSRNLMVDRPSLTTPSHKSASVNNIYSSPKQRLRPIIGSSQVSSRVLHFEQEQQQQQQQQQHKQQKRPSLEIPFNKSESVNSLNASATGQQQPQRPSVDALANDGAGNSVGNDCVLNQKQKLIVDHNNSNDTLLPQATSKMARKTKAKDLASSSSIPQPGESLIGPLGNLKIDNFDDVYSLGDIINEGAFGIVYKAHHKSLRPSDAVAVKVIDRNIDDDDDAAVMHETFIMKDLLTTTNSKNVVKLFDFYVDDNKFYIVQELAAGGDVFDRLVSQKRYTEKDVRDLAVVLLETVDSLHSIHLLHRDLKPENLLLKTTKCNSNILLCDFGYAKYLPDNKSRAEGGRGLHTHCGTPEYTAPEIVNGLEYWTEVDMWSLGCILYILLGGCQPFQGDNLELYGLISTCDWGFDDIEIWDNISKEAKSLISNLLILDGEKRLSAKDALQCDWFMKCKEEQLCANDLIKSRDRIKHYCEYVRPLGLHFIDDDYVGEGDINYTDPPSVANETQEDGIGAFIVRPDGIHLREDSS